MKPVDHYLKDLLFEYDCVTIPGLGGFIMQSAPARINTSKQRISPPSRYPSFNSLLSHDDGLLLSNIAKTENIDYREAGILINAFAEESRGKMKRGQRVELNGIGELSYGPDSALQFRPANSRNFHSASFGMGPVNLTPLNSQVDKNRSLPTHTDRRAVRPGSRQPASVRWTLLASLPVILFLLYGIIFPASVQRLYTNFSGIVYDLRLPEIGLNRATPVIEKQAPPLTPVVVAEPVIVKENPAPAVNTLPKQQSVISLKYYIIGGCFENERNADKFLGVLLSKGYEAELAGKTKKGHIRVSYKSFEEKSAALSFLQKIRDEENASAWLLKY
jgi:hypothetical protein